MKIIAEICFGTDIKFIIAEDEKTKERKAYIEKADEIKEEILPSIISTCVSLTPLLKILEGANKTKKLVKFLKNDEDCSKDFDWFIANFGKSANILDVIKWISQIAVFLNKEK